MRFAVLFVAASFAACSPHRNAPFGIGFVGPVTPRVAAAARNAELSVAATAPDGAATIPAGVPRRDGSEVTADFARLRVLTAAAIAEGASGIFFRLPRAANGRDYLEYAEESQAVDRVVRELLAVRPIMENGAPATAPFAVPAGVEFKAWSWQGRRYVLLANPSRADVPLDGNALEPWRALFAVRADPRESLIPCGAGRCLPAGDALWLEGRLLPDL
jgi:hypothetical protein